MPFVTSWLGENHLAALPVAFYGGVLIVAAAAYILLMTLIIRYEGPGSALATAMGRDYKGQVSLAIYAAAIGLAFVQPLASLALYVVVAMIWFIPDRRVERTLDSV